jgi:hypothetical protein
MPERGCSGAGLVVSESDEAGANKPHTLRTKAGAGPATELSCQIVAIQSRAGRVRVGRSGSPHAVDLGRSRTQRWAGPGAETKGTPA